MGDVLKPLIKQFGKWYFVPSNWAMIGEQSPKLKIISTIPLGMMYSLLKEVR